MNISNITNKNTYINDNINANKNEVPVEKNNILKVENIYKPDTENKINNEYVEKISSLSRGNISDTSDFNEGVINIITDDVTQIKYGFQIFRLKGNADSLTVGDMAAYMYNQNKVSSSIDYASKMLGKGMNKNSDTYKNDPALFDAVSNDKTGLARYIAELYFMVTAPNEFEKFSNNLEKYENTKLKDLSPESLHNLMIAKETGDIEIFNQVLNNLKLKENNLIDINSLQRSYSTLKKDIQNKPSVEKQQSILESARQKIFDKLLKK